MPRFVPHALKSEPPHARQTKRSNSLRNLRTAGPQGWGWKCCASIGQVRFAEPHAKRSHCLFIIVKLDPEI